MGGGSKVFAEKAPSNGETPLCHIQPRSNGNASGYKILGWRFDSLSMDAGVAAAILAAPGFEPPTKKSVAACITIWPLLILSTVVLPTVWTHVCH